MLYYATPMAPLRFRHSMLLTTPLLLRHYAIFAAYAPMLFAITPLPLRQDIHYLPRHDAMILR